MKRAPKAETGLSAAIQDALALEPGLLLFRNSTGLFRAHGHRVRAGLGNGSADLIGLLTVGVRPNSSSPAAPWGRFMALEVKRPGEKPEPHQDAWLASVRERGGFAAVVRSVDEARAAVTRARSGATS